MSKTTFTLTVNIAGIIAELEAAPGDTAGGLVQRTLATFFSKDDEPPTESCQIMLDGAALELGRPIEDQGVEDGAILTLHLPF